ncbi:MAG: SAM-dependent methyltransferase, partial [Lentisphaeria bacterium]|nr:SAM-dependent methyltransferase [Lentisphaeria bacterium]
MSETELKLPGSFRDPSGFVFQKSGQFCRRILPAGEKDFSFFLGSGLCRRLLDSGKIVPFTFADGDENTLLLEKLPFISYPYEWSFSQLKEAALLTLEIMEESLDSGMILKDASAFNVAFRAGKAVFMD